MGKRKDTVNEYIRYDSGVKAAFMKYRAVEDCLNCQKPKCNGCPTTEQEYLPKYLFAGTVKGI